MPIPSVRADPEAPTAQTVHRSEPPKTPPTGSAAVVRRSRSGGLWTSLILSAVVLGFLLVFILQNPEPVRITFLGLNGSLPIGVAILLAAIAGLLLVAIPGGVRMWQLRRAAQRAARR